MSIENNPIIVPLHDLDRVVMPASVSNGAIEAGHFVDVNSAGFASLPPASASQATNIITAGLALNDADKDGDEVSILIAGTVELRMYLGGTITLTSGNIIRIDPDGTGDSYKQLVFSGDGNGRFIIGRYLGSDELMGDSGATLQVVRILIWSTMSGVRSE